MHLVEQSAVTISGPSLVLFPRDGADADRTVVWLSGEHDVSTVEVVSEIIARAIALDDADVVVDLSGVQFMGLATIRAILRGRQHLQTRSRALLLRSPSRCARRVIDLCGLECLVTASDDRSHRSLAGEREGVIDRIDLRAAQREVS